MSQRFCPICGSMGNLRLCDTCQRLICEDCFSAELLMSKRDEEARALRGERLAPSLERRSAPTSCARCKQSRQGLALLAQLKLPVYRYDIDAWKALRQAGACALYGAVSDKEHFNRPIPPLADAVDALLESAGVQAIVASSGDGVMKLLTLDGVVRKRFDVQGSEMVVVKKGDRSALAFTNTEEGTVDVIDAYDWTRERIHRVTVGTSPDALVALPSKRHVISLCIRRAFVVSVEEGRVVAQWPMSMGHCTGAVCLSNDELLLVDGLQMIVVCPFTGNLKKKWEASPGRGQVCLLQTNQLVMLKLNSVRLYDTTGQLTFMKLPRPASYSNCLLEWAPNVLLTIQSSSVYFIDLRDLSTEEDGEVALSETAMIPFTNSNVLSSSGGGACILFKEVWP